MRRRHINAIAGLLLIVANGSSADTMPRALDPAAVKAGHAVYQQFCASCHGARGEGAPGWQQPDARGELPAPPHDQTGHTWKHSDAMLYRLVREGWRDPFNKTTRLTMPAFKTELSHRQTIAVITYLKSLWSVEQRKFQAEESRHQPFPSAPDAP